MKKMNKEQYNELIRLLYKNADSELKNILKRQMKIRGKILSEVSNILLIYSIDNNIMAMSKAEQEKEIEKLGNITKKYIQSGAKTQIAIITALLGKNIEEQYKFYSYNADKKDIKKIVAEHYKGKHFSDRVWENETEVARQINKHINDFVVGKIDVNDIKHIIMTDFNNGAYNTKRLVNTEVARVQDRAFTRFGEEVGVKYVRYNAELDSKTCNDCQQYDGKVFAFNNKIETPKHPMCRCYYEIVDDEYEGDIETNFVNDKYYNKRKEEEIEEHIGVNRENAPKVRERIRLRNWDGTREEYDKYIEDYKKEKEELKKYISDTIEKDKNRTRIYKDKKVAETKLKELGVKSVNLEGINPYFYDDLIKAIELNNNKFPMLKDKIEFIGTEKDYVNYSKTILKDRNIKEYMEKMGVSLEDATKFINDNMILGEIIDDDFLMEATNGIKFGKSFKNYEYVLEQEYENFLDGFRVQGNGTIMTSFTHEIGHNLDSYLVEKGIGTREILDKILTEYPNTNISEYGLLNRNEYFAELYADMMLSKNPSNEAKLLEKLLEEALK